MITRNSVWSHQNAICSCTYIDIIRSFFLIQETSLILYCTIVSLLFYNFAILIVKNE